MAAAQAYKDTHAQVFESCVNVVLEYYQELDHVFCEQTLPLCRALCKYFMSA